MDLQEKIEKLREGGASKLHVICDFDRTMSLVSHAKGGSSFSPVRRLGVLPEEYGQKAIQLFQHYYPFEIDPNLPADEKFQLMHEWWIAQFHIMIEYGFHRDHLDLIKGKNMIQFREGLVDFMKQVAELEIPMLILSAGFGDVIELVLEEAGVYSKNVHIVSNFMNYDESGASISYAPPIIHTFNKCEQELGPYKEIIQNRPNVLLVGDMAGDANMANGLPHDTVLKIGFLNEPSEEKRKEYSELFDHVIEKESTWGSVTKIWDQILSGGIL